MWTLAHQPQRIAAGHTLRIITADAATIHWTFDGWVTANDLETRDTGFGCWFGDVPSHRLEASARILFTVWQQERREERDFQVEIDASIPLRKTA